MRLPPLQRGRGRPAVTFRNESAPPASPPAPPRSAVPSQVTAILAAEVAMVFVARMRVVPVWTAVLPALLYPASLLLVWFLENIVGWD